MKSKGQPLKTKQPKVVHKPTGNNSYALAALGVILIWTFILFYPVLGYDFLNIDDPLYILENDLIKDLSWNGIKSIFTNFNSDNYAPVTDLMSAVQFKISGLSPAGFHLESLLFHLLNTGLVFWFVMLLTSATDLLRNNGKPNKGNWMVAAIISLFFGIHPLQVESVVWASARSNLFYTAFFLGSAINYVYYIRKGEKKFLFLSFMLFLLSILSKGVGVGLPFILLLIDYHEKRRINKKVILEKIPFFVIAVVSGVINLLLKQNAGSVYETDFSVLQRLLFGAYNFIKYIEKIFIPSNLSAYYPYPLTEDLKDLNLIFYIAPFIVLGIFFIAVKSMKFTRLGILGAGFYAITIFPLLQFISQGSALRADRYVYLPCIGLFLIIGIWYGYLLMHKKQYGIILYAIPIISVLVLSVITYHRIRIWKDSVTLWTDVIEKNPTDSYGYSNRGNAKTKLKDFEGALADCDAALRLAPNDKEAYFFRGNVKSQSKDYSGAIDDYDMAVRLNYPVMDKAYYFRGLMKSRLNDYKAAIMDYDSAILIAPIYPEYFMNRASAKYHQNDYEGAIYDNSEAIRLNTTFMGEAYFWRGAAESKLNRLDVACADFKKAAELGVDLERETVKRLCNW